jgi:hypothetical protein
MHLTARNKIPLPDLADGPADLPQVVSDMATVLDKAAMYDQGTLAQRPDSTPAAPGIIGRRYLATDDLTAGPNGTEYLDIGTAWIQVLNVPDHSVTNVKMTDDSVDERVLAPGSVGTPELIDGSVSNAKIGAGAVDAGKITAALKPSGGAGAATEALRAIGAAAGQVMAGNATPTPAAHAASHRRVNGVLGADQIPEAAGPGYQDLLQPGVMASGDLVVGLTLNADGTIGTGSISGGVVWIPDPNGFLRRHIAPSTNLFSSPPAGYPNIAALGAPAAGNFNYALLKLWASFNDWGLGPVYRWTYSNQVNTPNVYTTLEQAEASVMGAPVNPDGRSVCIFEYLMRSGAGTNGNWTSITFRDKRPWATGAHNYLTRQAGSNYARSSGTLALIDATNLQRRVEVSGLWPLRIRLRTLASSSVSTIQASFGVFMDGAELAAMRKTWVTPNTTAGTTFDGEWMIPTSVLPAGSHLFGPSFAGDGTNTLTLSQTDANQPLEFEIYEDMRAGPNLYNGTS